VHDLVGLNPVVIILLTLDASVSCYFYHKWDIFESFQWGGRPSVTYQAICNEATYSQFAGLCTLSEFPASAATYFCFIQHQMIAIPYRRTVFAQSCIVVLSNTPIFFFGCPGK
jgi:hypothetical protein